MALTRIDHWATRAFHDFLLARAQVPFAYGSNDCALFAADGILALTGVDVAVPFRGYMTAAGALKAIRSVTGGATVEDAAVWCAAHHSMPEIAAPFAQRGDLVLLNESDDLKLGLVHLNGRDVLVPGNDGLLRIPLVSAKRAWRVG